MMERAGRSGRAKLMAMAVLGATFLAGALAGAAAHTAFVSGRADAAPVERERRQRPSTEEVLADMGLTPAQEAEVQAILERRRSQMDQTWKELRPRMRALADSARAEIREVLDPEQRAAYDRFMENERKRQRRHKDASKEQRENR